MNLFNRSCSNVAGNLPSVAGARFSPLAFVFVETGEPQELPGDGGNAFALFVELAFNLFLVIT